MSGTMRQSTPFGTYEPFFKKAPSQNASSKSRPSHNRHKIHKSANQLHFEELADTYKGVDIASFESLHSVLKERNVMVPGMQEVPNGAFKRRTISQNRTKRAGSGSHTMNALDRTSGRSNSSLGGSVVQLTRAQKRGTSRNRHVSKRASSSLSHHKRGPFSTNGQTASSLNRLEIHSADRVWSQIQEELPSAEENQFASSSKRQHPSSSENPFSKKLNLPQILKQWDAAPAPTKNRLLQQFYDLFQNISTFRHLENQLGHYTYLLFMRFTAFLRMQYMHRKPSSLLLQLRVLKLYLKGQKALLQFLEIGGTAVLMDILCDVKQASQIRIEAIELVLLICSTGKKYKEIITTVDNGLASLEYVSLHGQLNELGFMKLQLLWIELCKNNPSEFHKVEQSLVYLFNWCRKCVSLSIPLTPVSRQREAANSGITEQHNTQSQNTQNLHGNSNFTASQSASTIPLTIKVEGNETIDSTDAEHVVRCVLMLCRVFRELINQHVEIQSLFTLESVDTQLAFLLHHDFPQIQLEVTHLLLYTIDQNHLDTQMHLSRKLIQILSQHTDGTNIRNIPGCTRLILRLLNTNQMDIIDLFLRCQVHLLLFDAIRDLNPLDYLVDTVKHIAAIIHFLLQFADPDQSDMIRQGVSKRIGNEQADIIEFNETFSTEFALHVQDCLISWA